MKAKLIIILFVLAVFIPFAFSNWGLTESSEARYAEISREMYQSGDYLHPKLLGIQHFHKPPVTYYITALGYSIFGINEYGARFFLQIALLAQVLLVFLIAQLLYKDRNLSLAAALIYFSYPVVQFASKNLTTDAYLTTFIFSSIYFFIRYHAENRRLLFLYLFYFFCGLAFLTKGPVGILPQLFFAISYVRFNKIKMRFGFHQIAGIVFCIILCASWFGILLLESESFLDYFVNYQLVHRVSGDVFKRSQPFWYYLAVMPPLALPAFIYFIDYCFGGFKKEKVKSNLTRLIVIPLVLMFIIFSASSSKLIFYVMPLYLFISILSARHLTNISLRKEKVFEIFSVAFAVLAFGGLTAACFIKSDFHLPASSVVPISIASILIVIGLYKFVKLPAGYVMAPLLNAATIALVVGLLPVLMKSNEMEINSIKPVAQFINSQKEKTSTISIYNYLLPSMAFYTNQKVVTINDGRSGAEREILFEKNNPAVKQTYFKLSANPDTALLSSITGTAGAYLVRRKKDLLPDSLSFIKRGAQQTIIEDKWVVYH
jgi:4-amino-4-deoxy-L-arabinose transferase-like glycosyltransferase